MSPSKIKSLSPFKRLVYWIRERENIRLKKEAGEPKPWTNDPILQSYRFCNVRREDDKVTRWIAANWRSKYAANPDVWFAMVVARLFNLPSSLAAIGFPIVKERFPYNDIRWQLKHRKQAGLTNFNGAYIVSTNGFKLDKIDYIIDHVLVPLWKNRKANRPTTANTLDSWHKQLIQANGLGSFLAGQVVADMKYVAPLNKADDWFTFAASGPGSRRGLNRVLGRKPSSPWKEVDWRAEVGLLQEKLGKVLGFDPPLHAQDVQNCLCEIGKYDKCLMDGRRPKQRYSGV